MSHLDASLDRAWLRQLQAYWQMLNAERLDGALRAPTFRLDEAKERLGSWHQDTRTLTISRHHILQSPWREVLKTLRHEMAHQVADELYGGHDKPHGQVFQRACLILDVEIEADESQSHDSNEEGLRKVLARVQKLMALAESDNPHEAQAAMAIAHRKLLSVHLSDKQIQGTHRYIQRVVGRSAAALPLSWKLIGNVLEEFFFVQCVWVTTYNPHKDRMERELELSGRPADVDMASWVHDFLHQEIHRLWRRMQRSEQAIHGSKRDFTVGVMLGFRDRLRAERTDCKASGLVWIGDTNLTDFVHTKHPRLRNLRGGGVRRSEALAVGRRQGQRLTIRKPVQASQSQRLLTRSKPN